METKKNTRTNKNQYRYGSTWILNSIFCSFPILTLVMMMFLEVEIAKH